jgi:hypothetical protein
MGRERVIRRDERTKHLDKLNYRRGRNEIRHIVALRQSDGEITQHIRSVNGNSSGGGRHAYRPTLFRMRQ